MQSGRTPSPATPAPHRGRPPGVEHTAVEGPGSLATPVMSPETAAPAHLSFRSSCNLESHEQLFGLGFSEDVSQDVSPQGSSSGEPSLNLITEILRSHRHNVAHISGIPAAAAAVATAAAPSNEQPPLAHQAPQWPGSLPGTTSTIVQPISISISPPSSPSLQRPTMTRGP